MREEGQMQQERCCSCPAHPGRQLRHLQRAMPHLRLSMWRDWSQHEQAGRAIAAAATLMTTGYAKGQAVCSQAQQSLPACCAPPCGSYGNVSCRRADAVNPALAAAQCVMSIDEKLVLQATSADVAAAGGNVQRVWAGPGPEAALLY
jgi:hypothetical protein